MDYKGLHYLSWVVGFLVLLFTQSIKNGIVVFLYMNFLALIVFTIVSIKKVYIRKKMKLISISGKVLHCGIIPIKTKLYGMTRSGAINTGITEAYYNYVVVEEDSKSSKKVLVSLLSDDEFNRTKEEIENRVYNDEHFKTDDLVELVITSFNSEYFILEALMIELYGFKQS